MIDVAMTRADVRACDVAVVIDVLRATTTVAQALAAGYESVLCVDRLERAPALRKPGRVLAGERGCLMPDGFDQGNSPREVRNVLGRELVLATTNGAPAVVEAARRGSQVVLAALVNLGAVVESLHALDPRTLELQIVCSGADRAIALEDVYVAGRVSACLPGPRSDAARCAEGVAIGFPTALRALEASLGATRLRAAGMADDVALCARESVLDVVPEAVAVEPGLAASRLPGGAEIDRLDTVRA